MWINLQILADLVTFTAEIVKESISICDEVSNRHLLCILQIVFEIFCVANYWSTSIFCWRDVSINNVRNIVFPFQTYISARQFFVFTLLCFCRLPIFDFSRKTAVCWTWIFLQVFPIKTKLKFERLILFSCHCVFCNAWWISLRIS